MKNKTLELKKLKTLESKTTNEINLLKDEINIINQKLSVLNTERTNIRKQIEKISNSEIIVSEHAMLRFIERELGIDLNEIKTKILTDSIKEFYEKLGNGTFPIENTGLKAVIKDNVVLTVK